MSTSGFRRTSPALPAEPARRRTAATCPVIAAVSLLVAAATGVASYDALGIVVATIAAPAVLIAVGLSIARDYSMLAAAARSIAALDD